MEISISPVVANEYPQLAIGVIVAKVDVRPSQLYVDDLKELVLDQVMRAGLTPDNYAVHPAIASWREVYRRTFRVKPSAYRCSLEALVKRVVRERGLPTINNIVDLYNCCSVISMLPMGALDADRVRGAITLRCAAAGEVFLPLGSDAILATAPEHFVYADEQNVLTWLWNHRDSRVVAIQDDTRRAVFFVDAHSTPWSGAVAPAVDMLAGHLARLGGNVTATAMLTATSPTVQL